MADLDAMTPEERADWMRKHPLTKKAMSESTASAHAFWEAKLNPKCHPGESTCSAKYVAPQGIIEFRCPSCGDMIGVFLIARDTPEGWAGSDED